LILWELGWLFSDPFRNGPDQLVRVVEDAAGVVKGASLDLEVGVDLAELVPESSVVAGFLAPPREAVQGGDRGGDRTKNSTEFGHATFSWVVAAWTAR
jgi:hypothetical protein